MSEKHYKILLVDDDEFLLDMYSVKFKQLGYGVEVAKSGEEAVAKMRSNIVVDAVLLDIVMPDLDGFEVLRIAKKEKLLSSAAFIFLTNLGQKEEVEKGLKLGADDYIVKAYFTPSEAAKKVQEILEGKSQKQNG